MKSLAESILSSTNSGKNKKIDVEYLLKHGFVPDTRYGSPKTMFKPGIWTITVIRFKTMIK